MLQHPKIAQWCDDSVTSGQWIYRLNINTEQFLLCFWWLPSVCQASNRWDFAQWSKKLISKICEDDVRVRSVSAALGWHKQLQSYCSKRFQSETNLATLEANLPAECNVQCCTSTNWLWPLICVHEHRPTETIHHDCSQTAVAVKSVLNATECRSYFLWSPYVIGQTIIFLPCSFYLLLSFFFYSSPNLSGCMLDV